MKKLAKPRETGKKLKLSRHEKHADAEGRLYVRFKLAEETYGVPISSVQEIIKPKQITEIPHTPDFLCGVVNLRGKIVPVIDLRMRLGLPTGEITKFTRIVIVRFKEQVIGMLVDSVIEVRPIAEEKIEAASPLIAGPVDSDFFEGVANLDERIVIILDIGKVLKKPTLSLPVANMT
ncbi:MAG: chemotaxis protein CheW [bacterium]